MRLFASLFLQGICAVQPFLFAVWFAFTMGSLFAKNARINEVFNNPTCQMRIITNWDLAARIGLLLAFDILVNGAWACGICFPSLLRGPLSAHESCLFLGAVLWVSIDRSTPKLIADVRDSLVRPPCIPCLAFDSLPRCLQSDVWVCESKYPLVWLGLLVVPKLVQLAYGVYIAFKASKPISRC